MADFSGGSRSFEKMGESSAAPSGLQQTAQRLGNSQSRWSSGQTSLQPWMPKDSMLETAKQWYAGANSEGTTNGWDTAFYRQAFNQIAQYEQKRDEEGRASAFFEMFDVSKNPNATGVATWDDPNGNFVFGDVFLNGVKQEGQNLYETFDEATADVMMGEFLFNGDQKQEFFSKGPEMRQTYRTKVEELRQANSDMARYAPQRERLDQDITERERAYQEGAVDDALIGGSSILTGILTGAGTAAAAAAAGTAWSGPGALVSGLIGGAVGGVVGGVSAWLNQDELVEIAARSAVQAELANEKDWAGVGDVTSAGFNLKNYSGLTMKMISPLSNAVHGAEELRAGKVGDLDVAFYATNEEGENIRPSFMTGLDLAGTLGDSVLQFASPAGRALYMGTMGTAVVGGTAALTTGAGFNERTGDFDEYDSAGEWAGAFGSVAIDAVQFGTAGLLGRAARHAREATTGTKETSSVLPKQVNDWLAKRDQGEVLSGIRFTEVTDAATGEVTKKARLTLEFLAPSEFMRWLPTGFRARQLKDAGRNMTADDLYNAALETTRYGSKFRDALITGYAEGAEEFAQAIFEPMSFSDLTWDTAGDAMMAAAYGAAGGMGMSFGPLNRRPNYAQIEEARARANYEMSAGEMSDEQWQEFWGGLPEEARRRMSVPTPEEAKALKDLMAVVDTDMRLQDTSTVLGQLGSRKALDRANEQDLSGANTVGGASLRLDGANGDKHVLANGALESFTFKPNTAAMSYTQLIESVRLNTEGLRVQQESLRADRDAAQAVIDDDNATQEQQEAAAQKRDAAQAGLDDLDGTMAASDLLLGNPQNMGELLRLFDQFTSTTDPMRMQQLVDQTNKLISDIYEGTWSGAKGKSLKQREDLRKVVELLLPRHPLIDAGSFMAFVPQVSMGMTLQNTHGTVHVHQATLKTLAGDHDGDNFVQAFEVYFPPDKIRNIRRGVQYAQQLTEQTEDGTGEVSWKLQMDTPDSEEAFVITFGDPMLTQEEKNKVSAGLDRIEATMLRRYSGVIERKALQKMLKTFRDQVQVQNVNARKNLVTAMFAHNAQGMFELADVRGVAAPLEIWSLISNEWDNIQQQLAYARHINRPAGVPREDNVPPPVQDTAVLEARARRNATVMGDMLAMLAADPVRSSQFLHYASLQQASTLFEGMRDPETLQQGYIAFDKMVKAYAELGAGKTQTDMEKVTGRNAVENRVVEWMKQLVSQEFKDAMPHAVSTNEMLLMVGNLRVPDIKPDGRPNRYYVDTDNTQGITLLQLLLRRSLQIEANLHAAADPDSDVAKKIKKLMPYTYPKAEHSNTAALTFKEIYGNVPMVELMGDAAYYIGPQMTLNQYEKLLLSMSVDERRTAFLNFKSSPHYFSHRTVPDAPWSPAQLHASNEHGSDLLPEVNAFTFVIDALQSSVSSQIALREHQAQQAQESFKEGLQALYSQLQSWRILHGAELAKDSDGTISNVTVLRDLLTKRPDIAQSIVTLIPEASALGVFAIRDGKGYAQEWLEKILANIDPDNIDEAMTRYFVYVKLAEWNVLQGTVDTDLLDSKKLKDADLSDIRGKVNPAKIQSRYLETLYHLASLNDGKFELRRFLKASFEAKSIEELETAINKEPMWLFGRADLQVFMDSTKAYELNPSDIRNSGDTDTLLRESIASFRTRMVMVAKSLSDEAAAKDDNAALVTQMDAVLAEVEEAAEEMVRKGPYSWEYAWGEALAKHPDTTITTKILQLKQAIENRQKFPDAVGQRVRENMMTAFQEMIVRMHDKGKAAEEVRNMGAAIITADTLGFGSGERLELNAITSWDWQDVQSNPTYLAQGPVRIMLDDGQVIVIDMSTPRGAMDMLKNPNTAALARAVLFPVVRDVNSLNEIQLYQNTTGDGRLSLMLDDESFASLFNETQDESELDKAYRGIGLLESYARRVGNERGTEKSLEDGYFPIQNMLNAMIVAYQTSAGAGRSRAAQDALRDQAVIDVWRRLKELALVPASQLDKVREDVTAQAQERFWNDSLTLDFILDKRQFPALYDDTVEELAQMQIREHMDQQSDLVSMINGATNPTRKAEYERQYDDLEDRIAKLQTDPESVLNPRSAMEFDSVRQMFSLTTTDPQVDMMKKAAVIGFLGTQDRINKLEGANGSIEILNKLNDKTELSLSALADKFRNMAWNPPGTLDEIDQWDPLTPEMWEQLSLWCTQQFYYERTTRSSGDVKISPIILGTNVDELRRLHDSSWSYLADPLFDPVLLEGMRQLMKQAIPSNQTTRTDDAARGIMSSILSSDRLGTWHQLIPMSTLKAKKVLDSAAVDASVAQEGNDPKQMKPWVATGEPTYDVPTEPQFFSQADLVVGPGADLAAVLDADAYLKLHNHFISSIEVIPDGGVAEDLSQQVSAVDRTNNATINSGLRVLNMVSLRSYLEDRLDDEAQNVATLPALAGGFRIVVNYVDADKKPHERAWVNNRFFDGVGRAWVGRSESGLIASTFFGLGGWSKVGQQMPLDALTKKGRAFRVFITSKLSDALSLEDPSLSVAEQLRNKALHMAKQKFPNGQPQLDDFPMLYKWVKSRHVMVGENPTTGEKEVWPVEKYITMQAQGQTIPLVGRGGTGEPQLVALSERTAQMLLGGTGWADHPQDLQRPELNPQYTDSFPSYDMKRLKELGLEKLGDPMDVGETPVTQFPALAQAYRTNRTPNSVRSPYEVRMEMWAGDRQAQEIPRDRTKGAPKEAFNVQRIRKKNLKALEKLLKVETLAERMTRLGVPSLLMRDVLQLRSTQRVYSKIVDRLGSNGMIWYYSHTADSPDLSTGLLAPLSLKEGFDSTYPPVFGDVVTIDLTAFAQITNGDLEKAAAQAKKVLDAFADRGVTIVLAGQDSQNILRQVLTDYMTQGHLGYKRVQGSGNFFEPIESQADFNATVDSLDSTLIETKTMAAKNMALAVLSQSDTSLSEGVRYLDPEHEEMWRRVQVQVLPTNYLLGKSTSNVFAFGMPQKGTGGRHDQFGKAAQAILDLVDHQNGRDELLRRMGDYPQGMEVYEKYDNGTFTPGIRGKEEALDRFLDALRRGTQLTAQGETIMSGDLYMTVAGDGSILLNRIGFQLPNESNKGEVLEAWNTPLVEGSKLRIAFTPAKVENMHPFVPPFTVESEDQNEMGLVLGGTYELGWAAKVIQEGQGSNKTTAVTFPQGLKMASGISRYNDKWITSMMSLEGSWKKSATPGLVTDFANAFALSGVDFRYLLVDHFYGESSNGPLTQRDSDDFDNKWDELSSVLKQLSAMHNELSPSEVAEILDSQPLINDFIVELNTAGSNALGSNWVGIPSPVVPGLDITPETRIAQIILLTMATAGISSDMVVTRPGLLTTQNLKGSAKVGWLPAVMTQAFNDPAYPEMRKMLLGWVNDVFPDYTDENGVTGKTAYFDEAFNFYYTMTQDLPGGGKKSMLRKGYLQLETPLVADENPVTYGFNVKSSRPISPHNAAVAAGQGGYTAREAPKKLKGGVQMPSKVDEVLGDNELLQFISDEETVWELVNRVMPPDPAQFPAKYMMPMEAVYRRKADTLVGQYRKLILMEGEGWGDQDKDAAILKAKKLLRTLNLDTTRDLIEVDYLVRQWFGIPAAADGQQQVETITAAMYSEAVVGMQGNVDKGMHPLHNAMVPLEGSAFWRKVYLAQEALPSGTKRWAPAKSLNDTARIDQNWDTWIETLMGQMRQSQTDFHAMFRTALDGFWHSYQGMNPTFHTMPPSMDSLRNARLLDPDTNEPFMSLDPSLRALMSSPPILETMNMTWDLIAGHPSDINGEMALEVPVSELAHRRKVQQQWLKSNKVTPQKKVSMMTYAKEGVQYQESVRDTNNFMRSAVHLSLTMRLFNPALYVSAIPEVWFRNQLENATNLLSGTQIGRGGMLMSKLGEKLGWKTRYSPEDQKILDRITDQLAVSNKLMGSLFGEMTYQSLVEPGGQLDEEGRWIPGSQGSISKALETSATWTARVMNDPRWGMRAKSVAQRYLGAALEYLELTGNNNISLETLEQLLKQDPLWLEKYSAKSKFNAHRAGVNAVAQVRSTRNTVAADFIMRPIDTMTRSANTGINITGHMLKIPFLFTRFNVNTLLTLTGMNSVDQMFAMLTTGRQTPKSLLRMKKAAKANTGEEITPEYMDYTDVLETLDIGRIFLRGGITQASLMTAGLMGANLLGLGGEDEEERRRKKMAAYYGTPYYYDMREAQNDFRWADALFLNNIPILNNMFINETGQSAVVPHWILRQFTSPLLGVVRFAETGNPAEVAKGFLDAISVLPTSVVRLFKEANQTATMLAETAADENLDVAEAQMKAAWLGVTLVGVYEKALLENQFINAWRSASDEYDRNPWAIPMTNDVGMIERQQGTGLPLPTDALQGYQKEAMVDPKTGEVIDAPENRVGYMTRSGQDALLHQYAENNATAAALLSIIPWIQGEQSSFLRNNMVVKQQSVALDEGTDNELEATVLSRFSAIGGQEAYTKDEIVRALKFRDQKAGVWWDQADIEKEADAIYKALDSKNRPISLFNEEFGETIAEEGGRGIYKSLMSGLIDFSDPALQGVYFTMEMRDKIGQEWMEEIVQEGVNFGLPEETAKWRARRLWKGDQDDPTSVGLRELLYSDQIPYSPTAEYNQLNVTYTLGPDGRPWATPFTRGTVAQAFGIPWPHKMVRPREGTTLDARGNVVDELRGINTGLAGLVPTPVENKEKPTDDALDKALAKTYTPSYSRSGSYGYGARRWGGSGYRRGGGGGYGGGGYGGGSVYPTRMNPMPYGTSARNDFIPMINSSNPLLRRADVRRERISSERGRLKQWQ